MSVLGKIGNAIGVAGSKIGSALSPSNRVAGIMDTIVNRLQDKYDVKFHITIDGSMEVVDKKPEDTVKLDEDGVTGAKPG